MLTRDFIGARDARLRHREDDDKEDTKEDLVDNVHDTLNDLIDDEHIDNEKKFQITESLPLDNDSQDYDNIFAITLKSCVHVNSKVTAGDHISVVAPVGLVFVKNISSTSSGFFFILASERPRTVRLIAGKCQRHAEKEAAVQRTS